MEQMRIYSYNECVREMIWEIKRRDPVTRSFFLEQTVYNLKQQLIAPDRPENIFYARAGLDAIRKFENE